MLQLIIKLILVTFYALLTACSPVLEPQGKDFFDAANTKMVGYTLGSTIDNIATDSHYTFSRKEGKKTFYDVKTDDSRQSEFLISVTENNTVAYILSRYEYPDFESCNEAVQKIYDANKDVYLLEKRGNISGKGYNYDGMHERYIFYTMCTDLLPSGKIIHSTAYMR